MYRTWSYITLFAAVALLQIFLFDNLSVSVHLSPLVYVAFIALLPMETKPIWVLLYGLVMGVLMDWTMGAAGINTISTLLICILRLPMLNLAAGKDNVREGGIPSLSRLGSNSFVRYLLMLVVVHNVVFFSFETLGLVSIPRILLRCTVSGVVVFGFVWLISMLFSSKLSARK